MRDSKACGATLKAKWDQLNVATSQPYRTFRCDVDLRGQLMQLKSVVNPSKFAFGNPPFLERLGNF